MDLWTTPDIYNAACMGLKVKEDRDTTFEWYPTELDIYTDCPNFMKDWGLYPDSDTCDEKENTCDLTCAPTNIKAKSGPFWWKPMRADSKPLVAVDIVGAMAKGYFTSVEGQA